MSKLARIVNIALLVTCIMLLAGCNNEKKELEEEKPNKILNEKEYLNEIGSEIALLIKSTTAEEINLEVAKESCEHIIGVDGTVEDEKLEKYQVDINEKANLIKSKCEYVLKNMDSDEVNGIEPLVRDLSQTIIEMIEVFDIENDNKGVLACISELNEITQTDVEDTKKEQESQPKNDEPKQQPNLLGTYTYSKYNGYGVAIESESITISNGGNKRSSFTCDSYYVQHAYSLEGEMIGAEDVTQEMVDQGDTLGRGSMMNGYIEYLGDNTWNGYIGYEVDEPTIPCKIVKKDNSITLMFDGRSITYKK